VARREHRRKPARREQQRMVVRRDAHHHAQRFAHAEIQRAVGGRDGLPFEFMRQAGVVIDPFSRDECIAAHLLDRIAAVGRVEQGEFIRMQAQATRGFAQLRASFRGAYLAPYQETPCATCTAASISTAFVTEACASAC
jgi:hypothetical protein